MKVFVLAALLLLSGAIWSAPGECPPGHDKIGSCGGDEGGGGGGGGNGGGDPGWSEYGGAGGGGGQGGQGGAGGQGGDSAADAAASAAAEAMGGQGGNASTGNQSTTVKNKSESNSVYLGAARDTAECFTKVQLGGEGFGLGFSRSDPYCKKVRLARRHIELGNYEAAARLECTLREWKQVYGDDKELCFDELLVGIKAEAEMEEFLFERQVEWEAEQQSHADEFEQAVDKMTQQQQLIDTQQRELDTLRRKVQAEEREDRERKRKFQEILKQRGEL